ncbi:MAG TPA: cbb3-type cytochrome c oxidase subunit I, partial [Solirubrobacterales bacterium]
MSTTSPRPAAVPLRPPIGSRRRATLLEVLSSTDHKRIGLLTMVTAFCWFLIGGAMAMTMRAELAKPGLQFLSDHTYNELFTMHGSTMFYLFAVPVVLGVGLYFVPLQLGAARLLWPRLALGGYWLTLAGGLVMYAGFLTKNGAPEFGWT